MTQLSWARCGEKAVGNLRSCYSRAALFHIVRLQDFSLGEETTQKLVWKTDLQEKGMRNTKKSSAVTFKALSKSFWFVCWALGCSVHTSIDIFTSDWLVPPHHIHPDPVCLSRVTLCLLETMVRLLIRWLWSRKPAALVEAVGRSAFGCSGCYPRSQLNCLPQSQQSKKQVPQL